MHTGTAIELPAAAADLCMLCTMITPADGAWLDTDRADCYMVDMTLGQMVVAKAMMAFLRRQMVVTEQSMAEVTLPHTLFAALFATLGTVEGFDRELPTAGTFIQTF